MRFYLLPLALLGMLFLAPLETGAECPAFARAENLGIPNRNTLDEISGMVASRSLPGALWVHNDSGDAARIFAMRDNGVVLAEMNLVDAAAVDWEDMAMGPGPMPEKDYLYIGDIGDNQRLRPTVTVYRVAEPVVALDQPFAVFDISEIEAFTLAYPDAPDTVHNAETLLVNPLNGGLYIVTKPDEGFGTVQVFHAPQLLAGETTPLTEVASMDFGTTRFSRVTGGDVSPDGGEVLLRFYGGVRLWSTAGLEELHDAFSEANCLIPVTLEQQSEVIAFTPDGLDFYTTSEWPTGTAQPIYRYRREVPVVEEGEGEEGEGETLFSHAADADGDGAIRLPELMRVVQFFNADALSCAEDSEDGFQPDTTGGFDCEPHSADYAPQDWLLSLSELLRVVQIFNTGSYQRCDVPGEDGFCFG